MLSLAACRTHGWPWPGGGGAAPMGPVCERHSGLRLPGRVSRAAGLSPPCPSVAALGALLLWVALGLAPARAGFSEPRWPGSKPASTRLSPVCVLRLTPKGANWQKTPVPGGGNGGDKGGHSLSGLRGDSCGGGHRRPCCGCGSSRFSLLERRARRAPCSQDALSTARQGDGA